MGSGAGIRKRETHIASEQRRRQHIKDGFKRLSDQLLWRDDAGATAQRSEVAILQRSIEFIKELLAEQDALETELRSQGKFVDSASITTAAAIAFNSLSATPAFNSNSSIDSKQDSDEYDPEN